MKRTHSSSTACTNNIYFFNCPNKIERIDHMKLTCSEPKLCINHQMFKVCLCLGENSYRKHNPISEITILRQLVAGNLKKNGSKMKS